MKASGDQQDKFTAETRSRGEDQKFTTEARRHGEDRDKDALVELDCFRTTRQLSAFIDHPITRSLHLCHPERVGAKATASRRTPAMSVPKHTASGSSYETLKDALVAACQTIRATLREIFDESAYDRFLLRTHASRSVASYRAFTQERDAAMVKKPRCC